MDFPFTDAEQRFVLAEAIKTSSIPVEKLISFIDDGNVQPAWTQMLLPLGRNLKSCMDAWNALRPNAPQSYTPSQPNLSGHSAHPGPPISSAHKRKPPSETIESFAIAHPPKRRQSAGETTTSTQRVIQPKPSNGQSPPLFPSPQPGQPKKRGRPSKAEVEARNADLVARGHVLPPPKTPTPRSKPPELAPREPDSMVQREASFFPARATMPPIMGPRTSEGPAPEPGIPFDHRAVQPSAVENEASDQPGKKKRRSGPKQAAKDARAGEPSPLTVVGAPSHFGSFETRSPAAPHAQVLAPRPADRTESTTVEATLVQEPPTAQTEAKETTEAPSQSGK
ncbi:hypothetical protein OIDMADRAFT_49374 [Oidiodendron maius Zn]|uniref:Uncharacterized protein n=1 Tax=Oidiodendron maius (strain Zn) TaxID=913774 RepID=A0A0C3D3L5_OIDMZ|nr:hypothetical protein OIDMADRAFT_49374 [Oidiodendron maius Zn]